MHVTEVPVRFVDLDAAGHVNNATYATYAEEARVAYCRDVLDAPVETLSFVIASLEITFEQVIDDVGTVRVETTVPELGETSFPMYYDIYFEGEQVATVETTQVALDFEAQSPRPLPAAWRAAISEYEGLD
jgi:acyl-CoA thioester hydrolase